MTEIEELNRECKRLHEQAAPQVQAPKTSGEDRLRDELRRFAEQKKQIHIEPTYRRTVEGLPFPMWDISFEPYLTGSIP